MGYHDGNLLTGFLALWVQKKGTLKAPEPVRWLEKHQLHTVCLYCPRIVPLYNGVPPSRLQRFGHRFNDLRGRLGGAGVINVNPLIQKNRSSF